MAGKDSRWWGSFGFPQAPNILRKETARQRKAPGETSATRKARQRALDRLRWWEQKRVRTSKPCQDCGRDVWSKVKDLCQSCSQRRRAALPTPEEIGRQLTTPFNKGTDQDYENRVATLQRERKENPL